MVKKLEYNIIQGFEVYIRWMKDVKVEMCILSFDFVLKLGYNYIYINKLVFYRYSN